MYYFNIGLLGNVVPTVMRFIYKVVSPVHLFNAIKPYEVLSSMHLLSSMKLQSRVVAAHTLNFFTHATEPMHVVPQ